MKGKNFLKVTGILMIIGSIIGIFAAVIGILGLSTLVALAGSAEGAGMLYAACILCLISGVLQLIAGIKGVKHSKRTEQAGKLVVWGAIVAVFSVLGIVMNQVNGGEFNISAVLTGVAVPGLYIYGAVLNSKADDTQYTV